MNFRHYWSEALLVATAVFVLGVVMGLKGCLK